jgi:thiamine kinase-like enzyme
VIHGEYYPAKNILYAAGIVCPVDWESAAIAAGEIDLAALTEGWSADAARECEHQYQRNRWPWGAPADFEQTLGAARLYLAFRWLGEEPGETTHERNLCRFDNLRVVGERLGLI